MKIYTIGHSNRKIHVFMDILTHYGITHLIDVRSTPYSRFEQFNQGNLHNLLKGYNIKYVYMGDTLGGRPDDPACYNKGVVEIENINYRMYERTDHYKHAIQKFMLASKASDKVICIMCSEKIPSSCHRHNLISKTLQENGFEISHIIDETFTTHITTYRDGIVSNHGSTREGYGKDELSDSQQMFMFE